MKHNLTRNVTFIGFLWMATFESMFGKVKNFVALT